MRKSFIEKHEQEIKRKVFHTLFGLGIVLVVYLLGNLGIFILLALLALFMLLSLTYRRLGLRPVRFFIERFGRGDETYTSGGSGINRALCYGVFCVSGRAGQI